MTAPPASSPSRPRSLRSVIFDGDGVLIRSMERNAEAYRRALRSIDLAIGNEEVFALEGLRSRELIARLLEDRGRTLRAEQLDELTREHQRLFESFGTLPLYPEAEAVLRSVRRAGLRSALVTANGRANALRNLGPCAPLLDVIVAAEDVRRSKPDPEPYLTALAKLGVSAREAVVVENAPLGVQAAKAAGLAVVAVTTTNPSTRLSAADSIIGRLSELPNALAALGWRLEGGRALAPEGAADEPAPRASERLRT